MNISPEKTAIKRSKPSRPLMDFLEDFADNGIRQGCTWLDYGCGHGVDLRRLLELGYDAYGYDPFQMGFEDETPLGFTYDVITCTYVLNVIPDIREREKLMGELAGLLKPGGLLSISARTHEEINKAAQAGGWEPFRDGYITSKGTFQVGVNWEWVVDFGLAHHLEVETDNLAPQYTGVVFGS